MSSEPEARDRRRGQRVLIHVPVQVRGVAPDGRAFAEAATAIVVSRSGALLQTPSPPKKDSALAVTNGFTRETEEFRVVWVSEKPTEGHWEVGIAALNPREDFWGVRFPRVDLSA
jgi:hypothetical protein